MGLGGLWCSGRGARLRTFGGGRELKGAGIRRHEGAVGQAFLALCRGSQEWMQAAGPPAPPST